MTQLATDPLTLIHTAISLAAILTGPFTVEALSSDYRRIVAAGA